MRIAVGLVLGIAAVIVLAVAFIYSGLYDVSAREPHNPVVRWALHTTMHRSVEARASEISAPPGFAEAPIQAGAAYFQAVCVVCHGAPGVEPSAIGKGLRPNPPPLGQVVEQWSPAELFWIVKHGIKMTGMPGFGATYSDEDLWAVVAFLKQLPTLSPEKFRALSDPERSPTMLDRPAAR